MNKNHATKAWLKFGSGSESKRFESVKLVANPRGTYDVTKRRRKKIILFSSVFRIYQKGERFI